jgi:rhamnose transport system ATP-binding protein
VPLPEGDPETAFLELLDATKHFGGVQALHGVSIEVGRGSVHALVGENGAGKSTLGRIVAGALIPDSGQMLLDGEPVSFHSPREALEHGIAAIAQEPSIVPQLTVAENVFLGVEPRSSGFLRPRSLSHAYAALARSAGFDLPGGISAGRLRTAEQQKVEILRALSREAQTIVMDEPTAALSAPETVQLHEIVRSLARGGTTIILISHFLREVLDLADLVTVLRDGRVVRTGRTADETEVSLVEAMLGRPLTSTFPDKNPPAKNAPVLLTVRDLRAPGVEGVSFEVRRGEIVGLAGLVGAGRTELARALYGAERVEAGSVELAPGGRPATSPRRSLDAGLALIPESRREQGLIFERSAIENVTLSRLAEVSTVGFVRRRLERKVARSLLELCGVRVTAPSAPVRELSGGNQQKVLLARMMLCSPQLVIADEPTRGIDVGTKRTIYDFLVSLAADGLGVLLISSELEELIGLAHRVLVMRRGRIARELDGVQMTESAILGAAFADTEADGGAA